MAVGVLGLAVTLVGVALQLKTYRRDSRAGSTVGSQPTTSSQGRPRVELPSAPDHITGERAGAMPRPNLREFRGRPTQKRSTSWRQGRSSLEIITIFGFSVLPLVGTAIVAAIGMAHGNIHFPADGSPPPGHTFIHNLYLAAVWTLIASIIITVSLGVIWWDNKPDPPGLLGLAISSLGLIGIFVLLNYWLR
jgi:hypothetical protein